MKQRTILVFVVALLLLGSAVRAQPAPISLSVTASAPRVGQGEVIDYTITARRTDPAAGDVVVRIAIDPRLTIISAETSPGNCDWRDSDNVVACLSVASASAPMVVRLSARSSCASAGLPLVSTVHAALAEAYPDGEAADLAIATQGEFCVWLPLLVRT